MDTIRNAINASDVIWGHRSPPGRRRTLGANAGSVLQEDENPPQPYPLPPAHPVQSIGGNDREGEQETTKTEQNYLEANNYSARKNAHTAITCTLLWKTTQQTKVQSKRRETALASDPFLGSPNCPDIWMKRNVGLAAIATVARNCERAVDFNTSQQKALHYQDSGG